jgi:uncharacterized membrane protein YkoI
MQMRKRIAFVTSAAVVLVAAGAAVGGAPGTIWDDGHAVARGSLDDGSELLPEAALSTAEAVTAAEHAAAGAVGQVDLVRANGRLVYVVDVGSREISVGAADGSILGDAPQS